MKILVLAAGNFHLGYVGCYGNDWIATPTLDRLAARGVVFDQHHADRPDAAGARRAWRTGCHGFPTLQSADAASPPPADLVSLLRHHGIATALVTDPRSPAPAEFREGWDHVQQVAGDGWDMNQTRRSVGQALARLKGRDRWLLWVELPPLAPPWQMPEEFLGPYFGEAQTEEDQDAETEGEAGSSLEPLLDPRVGPIDLEDDVTFLRLQRTYAAAVSWLDEGLGELLEAVEAKCSADELTVVFTADRGLPLGEHGIVGEVQPWLHEELIHLPFIIRLPGDAEAGRRVNALTQPTDLLPTVLDWLKIPVPEVHGHSLLPLLRGDVEQLRPYACAGLEVDGAVEWGLRTPEWWFLLPVWLEPGDRPRAAQLYVKPDDRWEQNNVLQHYLELTEHLEQTLRGFAEATRQPGPLRPPELRDIEAELAAQAAGPGTPEGAPS